MKQKNFSLEEIVKEILFPLGAYYCLSVVFMLAVQTVLGSGNDHYMICQIIADLLIFPFLYFYYYREDQKKYTFSVSTRFLPRHRTERPGKATAKGRIGNGICILGISALLGVGLNNLLLMSPLLAASLAYQEASAGFYGSSLLVELLGSAILTPILEELLYRGILYARLRRLVSAPWAVFVASLIFAILHFNIVQFIYALVLGLALCLFMEQTGHVYGAILGHMTINALSVLGTELGIFNSLQDKSPLAWSISILIFLAGLLFLAVYCLAGRSKLTLVK